MYKKNQQSLGRYQKIDSDFDGDLVKSATPILPTGSYSAYVRVYQYNTNNTLAFQTLNGDVPVFDISQIPVIGGISNFLG